MRRRKTDRRRPENGKRRLSTAEFRLAEPEKRYKGWKVEGMIGQEVEKWEIFGYWKTEIKLSEVP
ncbi:hypothetical protein CDL62_10930 [Alkalitalea saponilacus]|nr:hypothetical protein CDL62_10930 [Alkalitalea saponilacus]